MEGSAFLPLPEGMHIEQVQITASQLTVIVRSTSATACCPGCGCPSEHVHSQYQRTVHDVPCGGRHVVLRLHMRKFFCLTLMCQRKVFTERLPALVEPWARMSNRLIEQMKAIGLAASAEVSERLAPRLGMNVKAPTLLRHLRRIPSLSTTPVRVLGIDDFALRRGDRYGTLLVNIETGKPLDLLPDRTADAVLPWLKSHQEIEVVSRDRASAYADAVNRALPQAIQVADRYHLVQNLREHLQRVCDRKRTCLPVVEDTPLKREPTDDADNTGPRADPPPAEALLVLPERVESEEADHQPLPAQEPARKNQQDTAEAILSSLTYGDHKKQISRDKRVSRYEEIMTLHRAGMGQRAIARHLGISRKTVKLFVTSSAFPERAAGTGLRPRGKSKLDFYLSYLHLRWEAGVHTGSHLFDEIKERGYTGSASLLGKLLSQWRTELPPRLRQGSPRKPRLEALAGQRRLSSRQASFLMIVPPEKLTAKEQQQVQHICQDGNELHTIYRFSQEFVTLLKERQVETLDVWLKRAKESHIAELTSFANGISRDYAAVRAACSLPWSNDYVA